MRLRRDKRRLEMENEICAPRGGVLGHWQSPRVSYGYRFLAEEFQRAGHRVVGRVVGEERIWQLCSQQRQDPGHRRP